MTINQFTVNKFNTTPPNIINTKYIGNVFPSEWLWGTYEQRIVDSLIFQIEKNYQNQTNLLFTLTWFFDDLHKQTLQFIQDQHYSCDNLFLLTTVDSFPEINTTINKIITALGNPRVFKLGNFDTEYHFNFFAPILKTHFKTYTDDELMLTDIKYLYINYNRKPYQHRVEFVKKLLTAGLQKHGIITLGKPDRMYDHDPDNNLFLTLEEKDEDYVDTGHWYKLNTNECGIPHDVLSLHNMKYWQHHFLNIIGATEFSVDRDIFVTESQFKPIIGMRPFVINGNVNTYQWLRDNGFKTFNHYFSWIDLENANTVHESIIELINYLGTLSVEDVQQLYNRMLPDLKHNQQRFFKFADEQQYKIDHLFENNR